VCRRADNIPYFEWFTKKCGEEECIMTLEQKRRRSNLVRIIVLVIITLIHIIPFIVMILNALRPNSAIEKSMLGLPTSIYWENFVETWIRGKYAQAFRNSLYISTISAIVIVILNGLAAYGLNKTKCFFPNFFRSYFYAGLVIPAFAVIVPLYYMFNRFGLVDNHLGIMIIYVAINIPFSFIFMDAFFKGLPLELDDAARIDGASELQNFFYISAPLAKPIFSSLLLVSFVRTWNEFLFSNTFLSKDVLRPVSLRFFNFVGRFSSDLGYVFAAAIISISPIVIIYFLTQKSFIEGMTSGSVKK
jgi:raffinose/stachyose/melibiose transport system permease protein